MPLIRLIFVSAATKAPSPEELASMLSFDRATYKKRGITGLLLYRKLAYFQVLEGRKTDVEEIYDSISRDSRREQILLLLNKVVKERNFPDWRMGFADVGGKFSQRSGFVKLNKTNAESLKLQGDSRMVLRLIEGFHEGQWR